MATAYRFPTDQDDYDRDRDDVALLTRAFCDTGTVISEWQVALALDALSKHLTS